MLTDEWFQTIHSRLIQEDPTASSEIATVLLGPLAQALRRRYPNVGDPHLIDDAITDALLGYIKNPNQFDPAKRKLFGYLFMSADGDLRNALAKEKRRSKKETAVEDVELGVVDGKEIVDEAETPGTATNEGLLLSIIDSLFDNPLDKELAKMVLEGERSTERFCAVLRLGHVSKSEQRAEVKRHKDRIKKRLERFKEDNYGRTERAKFD